MGIIEEEEVYDVLIVGAGPCGLSTAARLREHTPDALFTDEEHRRYHWINKHGKKVALKHVRSGKLSSAVSRRPDYKMAVLDASDGSWLGRWKTLFKAYDISHLRSPMLWHVDPLDRDAMLAHAYRNEREDEMVEIRNCVGKEISKHTKKQKVKVKGNKACGGKQAARIAINLRDQNDYYTPSLPLFVDHCQDVVDRYNLGANLIYHETVQDIDYSVVRGVSVEEEKLFTVTSNLTRRYAKTVVLAVGPANAPRISEIPSMPTTRPLPQACHSMHVRTFPDAVLQKKIDDGSTTNILVVGGGLTSAQLTDLAIRKGVAKVWHIMRGPVRVKHFDVDLEWMGKYKNAEQARFWTADSDEERLAIIKETRGGGSFTPLFNKKLKKHIASGKLELRKETKIVDAKFEGIEGSGSWTIQTDPPIDDLPPFDHICFATGIQSDFTTLPYLQTMNQKFPVKGFGGFPCINEDLMWKDDIPLFLAGRLASLQLGPAAPNIGGAKIGAERIAWAIEDLIKPTGSEEWDDEEDHGLKAYLSGHANMYSSLECE